MAQLLDRALEMLDDEKREVFVLFDLEELPMNDVAAMLRCPIKTAYSRLYAARELVRSFAKQALNRPPARAQNV